MDTTETTTELMKDNEKYNNMAKEYSKNHPQKPLPPKIEKEISSKIERLNKRARQPDSDLSDNSDNIPTSKKTKADTTWIKYFIIESIKKEGATLKRLSPFAINKYITAYVGEVVSVNKLRSGSLLVEAPSRRQSDKIQNIKNFGEVQIKISPHNSLNSKKGVIHCADFKGMTNEDLLAELKDQGVTNVTRIKITNKWNERKYKYIYSHFRHTSIAPNHHCWLPQAGRNPVCSEHSSLLQVPEV